MDQKNCTRCQMQEKIIEVSYQTGRGGDGCQLTWLLTRSIGSCDSKSRRRPGCCSWGTVRGMGRLRPMVAAWLHGRGGRRDRSCPPSGHQQPRGSQPSSVPMRAPRAPPWTAVGAVGELSTIGVTSNHGDLSRLQCAYARSTCSSSDTGGDGIGGGIGRFVTPLVLNMH
jgi:hypothetical protein